MWPKPHLETTKTPLWPMDAHGPDCKVFFKDPWGGKPLSPHVTCSPAIAGTSAIAEEIWTFTRVLPTQPELCWLLVISLCFETRSARIDYIGFLVIKLRIGDLESRVLEGFKMFQRSWHSWHSCIVSSHESTCWHSYGVFFCKSRSTTRAEPGGFDRPF